MLFLSLFAASLLLISPAISSAATIKYWLTYLAVLDQYRMDYTYPTGTVTYNLEFTADSGAYYKSEYSTVPTGIMFLTCNGNYTMNFFDASGTKIGFFTPVHTFSIKFPTCNSYAGQDGLNELNITKVDNSDGTTSFTIPSADPWSSYDVYRDGQKITNVTGGVYTGQAGPYMFLRKDANDQITGRSDFPGTPSTGGSDGSGDSGSGGGSGGDGEDCSAAICECIGQLKTVMQSIDAKTDGVISGLANVVTATNQVKASVDQVKTSVDAVKQAVDSLHDEFKTTNQYPVKTVNDYPTPNLDVDKPPMQTEVINDTNVYFTDQGDAEEPPAFPLAPDPVTSWETGNGSETVEQQPTMTTEQPLERDEPSVADPVPSRAPVLHTDPVPTKDDTVYPLRWDSSQYQH